MLSVMTPTDSKENMELIFRLTDAQPQGGSPGRFWAWQGGTITLHKLFALRVSFTSCFRRCAFSSCCTSATRPHLNCRLIGLPSHLQALLRGLSSNSSVRLDWGKSALSRTGILGLPSLIPFVLACFSSLTRFPEILLVCPSATPSLGKSCRSSAGNHLGSTQETHAVPKFRTMLSTMATERGSPSAVPTRSTRTPF